MKLELNEIIEKIQKYKKTPDWIVNARKNKEDYEALILGKDFHKLLNKVEHRESEEQLNVRRKYSRSVKDIFIRIFRNLDNIYSSTGGIIDVNTKDKKPFFELRSNVRNGQNLTKWLELNWVTKLYNTDPNGLMFYEINDNKPYLTYKSIDRIRAYKSNGQFVEWVLFEPERDEHNPNIITWRFVDDEYDYIFIQSNDTIRLDEENTIPNAFKKVPACINSDIEQFGTKERLPMIHYVVELCKEFLKDSSIKTIFKQLHGMPIFWRYAVPCNHCKGQGVIDAGKCPHCDGQGYLVRKDIADAVILPVPTSDNSIKLAPDMAGYVVPPLDIWEQYNKELELLEALIYATIWGSETNQSTAKKTVIETVVNAQPVINSLNKYADSAQNIEWVLSELLIPIAYPTNESNDIKVTIAYGRNFILEAVSDLLTRYHEDKTNGDNSAILDRDLMEWLHAKYKNNPIFLNHELKRIQLEPYIHLTIEQIKQLFGNDEAKKKVLFVDFWKTADKDLSLDVLKTQMQNYFNTNIIKTTENENSEVLS